MPALEPVAGVARVVYSGTLAGVTSWACIMHMQRFVTVGGAPVTTAWSQVDISQLAQDARIAWNTNIRPVLGSTVALVSTSTQDLTSNQGAVGVDNTNVSGALTGTACPAQVAQVLSWRESFHYRGGHPRNYLPPPTMTQVSATPNTWASTHVTALENAGNGFLTTLAALSYGSNQIGLVAVHRTSNHATLAIPIVNRITACTVDSRIDTQRRRLGRDV